MARVPNYIYRGDNLGIGQGISNLGQALFGDPQAASAMEAQKTQNDYTRALMEEHRYNTETKRADRERNQIFGKALMEKMGFGADLFNPGASPAAPGTMDAAVPSLVPPTAPQPGVLDNYTNSLTTAAAPTITTQSLGQLGEPPLAPQPIKPVSYTPGASLAGSDMWNPDEYTRLMQQRESRGRPTAKNPNSSAYGLSQFTQGTWEDIGMPGTPQEATPEMYAEATRRLTDRNRGELTDYYGESPDSVGTYTAHHYGATGAKGILNAAMDAPDTPINQLISPEAFAANRRELTNPDGSVKTAGQLMGEYRDYFQGNSPMQAPPVQDTGAGGSLVATMTPDINTLNPQLQTAMPGPGPSPDINSLNPQLQTAMPGPAAPAPMLAKTPGSLMNSAPASQPIAPAAAPGPMPSTTPTQPMQPTQQAQTAPAEPKSGLDGFIDSLSDQEKLLIATSYAKGDDVLDTISGIVQARIKAGVEEPGMYGGTAMGGQEMNVLNRGTRIMREGGTMDPALAQQYVSAWMMLSKTHAIKDENGQEVIVPGVNLKGYNYLPPPGVSEEVLNAPDMPTKPRGQGEQAFGAAVQTAQTALDAALKALMPDGKNLKSEWTSIGMYQPKSKIGQTIMSRIAPKEQTAASQFQNAVNQAYNAISGKAVTESEAGRLFMSFIPTPFMDRGVAGQRMLNLKDLIDNLAIASKTRGRQFDDQEMLEIMQNFDPDAPIEGAVDPAAPAADTGIGKLQEGPNGELQ